MRVFVVCVSGRRQRGKTSDKKQDIPFISGLEPTCRNNGGGGNQPIYRPPARSSAAGRTRATDEAGEPALDRSGHGDLGLGLVRQASLEGLDENGHGGMREPRRDPIANRYEDWFLSDT